jgi:putative NIF3 family GTP cyclohydrolase 1 type 2
MAALTRRDFAVLAASTVTAPFRQTPSSVSGASVSAAEIVERIRKNAGVEWKAGTVDTIKAGAPATMVSGIVTTAMASLSVLRQAAAAGANMIVTCEPTFYGRSDARQPTPGRGGRGVATGAPSAEAADPVYSAKNGFIEKHGLVVFRLIDHWRNRRPDPFAQGMAAILGWAAHQESADGSRYAFPAVTLESLAADIGKKLGSRGGIRVVGDPGTTVQTAALLPGSTPIAAALDVLPAVDLIVAGEVREWESVEYARDAAFSGRRKGLVLVGRIVSEEGGMNACAKWLAPLVPGVPVRHLPAGDPYWRPA